MGDGVEGHVAEQQTEHIHVDDSAIENTDSSDDDPSSDDRSGPGAGLGRDCCCPSVSEAESEDERSVRGEVVAAANPIDAALEDIGFGRFQCLIMLVCGMGWFVDSVEVGGMAYVYTTLDEEWGTTTADWGVLQSTKSLCSVGGALVFGASADHFGRRPSFVLALLLTAVAGIASAGSSDFRMLLILRSIANVGAGGILPVAISLLSEHLPPSKRDSCVVFMHIFFSVGHVAAVVLSMTLLGSGSSWRVFIASLAAPGAVMLVACPWVPESPSYLMMTGQEAKAEEALKLICRVNGSRTVSFQPVSQSKHEPMKPPETHSTGMLRLVSAPQMVQRMALFGALWACCMAGSDYSNWITELGEKHGFHRHAVEGFMIFCKFSGVAAFFTAAFASRGGRGHLVLRGALAACAVAAGLAAWAVAGHGPKLALPAAVLLLYFPYDMVWGLIYATTSKAFDPLCRASALSVASCCSRLSATLVPLLTGRLLLQSEVLTTFFWAVAWLLALLVACAIDFSEPGMLRATEHEQGP